MLKRIQTETTWVSRSISRFCSNVMHRFDCWLACRGIATIIVHLAMNRFSLEQDSWLIEMCVYSGSLFNSYQAWNVQISLFASKFPFLILIR